MTLRTFGVLFSFVCSVFAQESGSGADYVAEVKSIADATGISLEVQESDNFVFAFGIPKAQGAPIVKAAEDAFKIWKEISGISGWQEMWGTKKCLVGVLGSKLQYERFAEWYEKTHAPWPGFKDYVKRVLFWPQDSKRVCTFMHQKPHTLAQLRSVVAHEIGHLCVMRYKFNNHETPAWLQEGMGCYIEMRVIGRNNCYCFSGGYGDSAARLDKLTDVEWVKWKQLIAGMGKAKLDRAMKEILRQSLTQLTAEEIGKSISVIDFLVKKDPQKFMSFIAGMKRRWPDTHDPQFSEPKGEAQNAAMKEAFGFDLEGLDAEWRSWVVTNYN